MNLQSITEWLLNQSLLTASLSFVTVVISLYNWRASRFRTKLKDDLDILKRLRDEFEAESDAEVKVQIEKAIRCLRNKVRHHAYKGYVLRRTDWSDILTGLTLLALAGVLASAQWPNWVRITGVAGALGAAAWFLWSGWSRRNQERKEASHFASVEHHDRAPNTAPATDG